MSNINNIATLQQIDSVDSGIAINLPSADEFNEMDRSAVSAFWESQKQYSDPVYKCPKCGGGMCRDNTKVLTSYPPQYEYRCNKCGHISYHHI